MAFIKAFLKKVFFHAAVAYGGYRVGEFVEHEPIIGKPEIIIPPQREEGIAPASHIVMVLVILVVLSFLLVTIKYIIKRLTAKKSEIIPLHQCSFNAQKTSVKVKNNKRRDEVEADSSS